MEEEVVPRTVPESFQGPAYNLELKCKQEEVEHIITEPELVIMPSVKMEHLSDKDEDKLEVKDEVTLEEHAIRAASGSGDELRCSICGKTFKQSSVLLKHERTHTGERPYRCNICGGCFSQSGHLTRHLRTHGAAEPTNQCSICEKTFSRSSDLLRHLRIHKGEKSFKCDMCTKSFLRNSDLVTHQRSHTGERPYGCKVCGRSYSRKGILSKHEKTHEAEQV